MNFKDNYQTLLIEKQKNTAVLSHAAKEIVVAEDFSPIKWIAALAVCEAALEAGLLDESIKELFKQLFHRSRDRHVGMVQSDADYVAWREQVQQVCRKMIAAGNLRAWAELAELYQYVRAPHRDTEQYRQTLLSGIAAGDVVSMAIYGYGLFFGLNGEPVDQVQGRSWIEKSKEGGYDYADLYLLIIEFNEAADPEEYLGRVQACMEAVGVNRPWALLGDVYSRKMQDLPKAVAAYEKGAEEGDAQSKFVLGTWILNGNIEGADEQRGIQLLEEAFSYQTLAAANFLGQYYSYNQEARNIEKAIEWYKKAIQYYDASSLLNLALLYIYDKDHKDMAKALPYLDQAIAENQARAMSEKAYLLLESEEVERDIPKAKELLERATELGDDYAPYRLARGYQNCEFCAEPNYAKALEYYLLSAERNYVYAMEMAGRYFRTGVVDEPNAEQAVAWYRRAIEYNSDYARVELAFCHEVGFGVEEDYHQAYELFHQAAENDYTFAHIKLGYYYMDGVLGDPDYDKAFDHFTKAAAQESAEGYYNLGRMYKYAIGRPENPALAMDYFLKGVEGDDWDAHVELALAYENEYAGYPFDAEKALEYMEKAAENGIPYAQYKLGYYYYFGIVEADMEKGLEWLRKAHENGSPLAALTLGDHYLYSRGDEDDNAEGFSYYKSAEKQGYVSEGIGLCYQYGIGVEQNYTEAFKYYNMAADLGYTSAKYRVGLCHKYGNGTVKSMSEAYGWLLQAAEEGNSNAQYEVGCMLLEGDGTAMDMEKGIGWLVKAAEEDQDDAQLELGNCYLMGKGVDEDEVQAMFWFQKAAENGNEHALKLTGQRKSKRR